MLDDFGALGLGLVENLTVQAVHAFIGVDLAGRVDRIDRAFVGAGVAGRAAHLIALEPVEHADAGRDRESGTQGAEVAAIEAFDEKADDDQGEREDDKGPVAYELENDGGFEGFNLGQLFGEGDGRQRDAEEAEEDHVFQRPEPFVKAPGQFHLRDFEQPSDAVGQFLKRSERTKPAAIGPAPPEQKGGGDGEPLDKDQRIEKEGIPGKARAQGTGQRHQVHHGKLRVHHPAQPDEREGQEPHPEPEIGALVPGDLHLEEEDAGQKRQHHAEDADFDGLVAPDALPEGGFGLGLGGFVRVFHGGCDLGQKVMLGQVVGQDRR